MPGPSGTTGPLVGMCQQTGCDANKKKAVRGPVDHGFCPQGGGENVAGCGGGVAEGGGCGRRDFCDFQKHENVHKHWPQELLGEIGGNYNAKVLPTFEGKYNPHSKLI